MFRLDLDPAAKLPVYRQIIDQTHFAINTGALAAGERLASLRELSQRHGVKVFEYANGGDQLHLILRAKSRAGFQAFLRAFAGDRKSVV